jgi:hypothetical protein
VEEEKKTSGEIMCGVGRMLDEINTRLGEKYGGYLMQIGGIEWTHDSIPVTIKFDRDRLP